MVKISDLDGLHLNHREVIEEAIRIVEETETILRQDPAYVEAERRLAEQIERVREARAAARQDTAAPAKPD